MSGKLDDDRYAEEVVLGACILDGASMEQALCLKPEDFSHGATREAFAAMRDLVSTGVPVDPVTLRAELSKRGSLERVGGPGWIAGLIDGLPRISNPQAWLDIVRRKAQNRRMGVLGQKLAAAARDGADDLVERAMKAVMGEQERSASSAAVPAPEALRRTTELIEKWHAPGGQDGCRTGLEELDELVAPILPGRFVVFGARPAQGKTALGLKAAETVASDGEGVALVFSLEMSVEELTLRRICQRAKINSKEVQKGRLLERDWGPITAAYSELAKKRLFIDDAQNLTVPEMRARARLLRAQQGRLDLVVVDYLQLIGSDRRYDNREREVATISRGLKGMAMDLDVPVIACAQLNRNAEGRKDGRPEVADLRESGAVEQDADLIVLVWRKVEYTGKPEDEGYADLIVAKQRNGPTGIVAVRFDRPTTAFENVRQP